MSSIVSRSGHPSWRTHYSTLKPPVPIMYNVHCTCMPGTQAKPYTYNIINSDHRNAYQLPTAARPILSPVCSRPRELRVHYRVIMRPLQARPNANITINNQSRRGPAGRRTLRCLVGRCSARRTTFPPINHRPWVNYKARNAKFS